MAAILKIVKSPYLSEKLSDFDEIQYTTANAEPIAVTWPKINSFKIQDGGDRRLENREITISQWNYYWILTKFGVLQNILNLMMFSKALSQYLRCDKDVIR